MHFPKICNLFVALMFAGGLLLQTPVLADSIGTDYLVSRTLSQGLPTPTPPANGCNSSSGKSLAAAPASKEPTANTMELPGSILSTGTDIHTDSLSPNAVQLADELGLTPLFARLRNIKEGKEGATLPDRVEALELHERISERLRRTEAEVNFVLSEIYDEQSLYQEVLGAFTSERDKTVAITNAISFGSNGALWAIGEALDIPTYRYPRLAIPSGFFGIIAGVIPSVASALTLKEVTGKKHSAPAAPNMLSKLFGGPTTIQNDYPDSVWAFLNAVPASEPNGKRRKEQIIDRWIADKNIPSFTDRSSQAQIDLITAAAPQQKTLTISVLSTRLALLGQLASETFKMNRLILELEMCLDGTKHS